MFMVTKATIAGNQLQVGPGHQVTTIVRTTAFPCSLYPPVLSMQLLWKPLTQHHLSPMRFLRENLWNEKTKANAEY